MLKLFIQYREWHDHFGKIQSSYYFVIQNVGTCGITVLSCSINGLPIEQYEEFSESNSMIIGAKIEPKNSVRCQWLLGFMPTRVSIGNIVKLGYLSDAGIKYEKDFTLSEEAK